jgi:hypothetical protein
MIELLWFEELKGLDVNKMGKNLDICKIYCFQKFLGDWGIDITSEMANKLSGPSNNATFSK